MGFDTKPLGRFPLNQPALQRIYDQGLETLCILDSFLQRRDISNSQDGIHGFFCTLPIRYQPFMRRTSNADAMGYDWICTLQRTLLQHDRRRCFFCNLNLLVPFIPKMIDFCGKVILCIYTFLLKYRKIMWYHVYFGRKVYVLSNRSFCLYLLNIVPIFRIVLLMGQKSGTIPWCTGFILCIYIHILYILYIYVYTHKSQ